MGKAEDARALAAAELGNMSDSDKRQAMDDLLASTADMSDAQKAQVSDGLAQALTETRAKR